MKESVGAGTTGVQSSRLFLFGGGVFAVESGFFAVVPPLVPQLVKDFHFTTTEVGILVAAYPAGTLIGAIASIELVDRWGVRTTALAGLSLLVVATVGFAIGTNGLILDGARAVQGVGGAAAWTGALAWLTSTASPQRRGAVIGGAVGSALVGTVFGPAVGALGANIGRRPVFGTLAVILVLLAFSAPSVEPVSSGTRRSLRALWRLLHNRSAANGNAALFVIGVGGGTLWTLTPLLFTRFGQGAATIAGSLAVGYLIAALINVILGRLTDRIGRTLPTVCLFCAAAALLPWLPVLNPPALVITSTLVGAALSGLWTPAAAMVSDGADPGARGQAVAVALMNAAWASGGSFGPAVMATIADNAGFVLPFAVTAALCGVMAAATISTHRRNASVKDAIDSRRPKTGVKDGG